MKWLTGYTEVSFPKLDLDFNVYENLVEFTIPGWDIDVTYIFFKFSVGDNNLQNNIDSALLRRPTSGDGEERNYINPWA